MYGEPPPGPVVIPPPAPVINPCDYECDRGFPLFPWNWNLRRW